MKSPLSELTFATPLKSSVTSTIYLYSVSSSVTIAVSKLPSATSSHVLLPFFFFWITGFFTSGAVASYMISFIALLSESIVFVSFSYTTIFNPEKFVDAIFASVGI